MGITAKELAARLNLSATAVSMALNGNLASAQKPEPWSSGKQKKPAMTSADFP